MFVTNWISTTKIQKISEITNFFRHYFLSRTEVVSNCSLLEVVLLQLQELKAIPTNRQIKINTLFFIIVIFNNNRHFTIPT